MKDILEKGRGVSFMALIVFLCNPNCSYCHKIDFYKVFLQSVPNSKRLLHNLKQNKSIEYFPKAFSVTPTQAWLKFVYFTLLV